MYFRLEDTAATGTYVRTRRSTGGQVEAQQRRFTDNNSYGSWVLTGTTAAVFYVLILL